VSLKRYSVKVCNVETIILLSLPKFALSSFAILSERNVTVYFGTSKMYLVVQAFLSMGSDALVSICFQLTYGYEQEKSVVSGCFSEISPDITLTGFS